MSDNPSSHSLPTTPLDTPLDTADDVKSSLSSSEHNQTVMESVLQLMAIDLEQTIEERKQRSEIGGKVARIVTVLPFILLALFWAFVTVMYLCSDKFEELSTLIAIMFVGTNFSVIILYFALIQGMFQRKKDNDVSLTMLHQVKSLLEKLATNVSGS